jgi:hypothetical protein
MKTGALVLPQVIVGTIALRSGGRIGPPAT